MVVVVIVAFTIIIYISCLNYYYYYKPILCTLNSLIDSLPGFRAGGFLDGILWYKARIVAPLTPRRRGKQARVKEKIVINSMN